MRRVTGSIVVLVAAVGGCLAPGHSPPTSRSTVSLPPATEEASRPQPSAAVAPRLLVAQGRGAATVLAFFDAYNGGRVSEAARLLTHDVLVSDCDYRVGRSVRAEGIDQATALLQARIADHDAFVLADLLFNVPEDVAGRSFAIGISYARRTSDVLRSLGLRDGIVPRLATKAVLTKDGDRIMRLVNAPEGPAVECQVG